MENFILQDHCENQEQIGRLSSGGAYHRSYEYEEWGDEQKTEKNGGVIWGRQWPRRAIAPWMDGWIYRQIPSYFGTVVLITNDDNGKLSERLRQCTVIEVLILLNSQKAL